jgi:hypothetical protein
MKNFSLFTKTLGKLLVLPAFAVIAFTVGSCSKKENLGILPHSVSSNELNQSKKLRTSVSNAINLFVKQKSGRKDFSDPAYNYTTYSTPNANVYQWSDPTSGTVFSFAESTGGAGGLGQLAYNGKSFDYNYVLTIKASGSDPAWNGFLNGRDLIGVVAIDADGEITNSDFTLKNFAIFLAATNGGAGTYEFNSFDATTISNTFAVGEIIDLSDMQNATLANFADGGHVFYASDGHLIVSSSDFTMGGDAMIKDFNTAVQYSISGAIMFE